MLNIINRVNTWYDGLKEPKRFGFFMIMMLLSVFPLHLGVALKSTTLMLCALVPTVLVTLIAAVRAHTLGGKHIKYSSALVAASLFLLIAIPVFALL